MKRTRYSLIMPIGIAVIIASGFAISPFFPGLTAPFYLIYALCGGVIVLFIDRTALKRVTEPITDERLQGLVEKAYRISNRIGSAFLFIAAFILIFIFGDMTELKFIGLGALLAISVNSLVFTITYEILKRRTS